MDSKKSWVVNLLKKLFLCESESLPETKTRRLGRILGSFKKLKQLPASSGATTLSAAREEQRKHALNVAKATAAAAEVAVAAAQAAATLVRLTEVPQQSESFHFCTDKEIHHWAATKIQTAFRGYLARKALRALKALVRLQAMARGRAVRRCLERAKLKPLLSSSSSTSLSHVRTSRALGSDEGHSKLVEKIQPASRTRIELGEAIRAERDWNNSMFTKEEAESVLMRKQEAINRRERMKQYSFSHRERHLQNAQVIDEPLFRRHNERQSFSIRNHLAEEKRSLHRKEKLENILPTLHSKPRPVNNNFDGNLRLKHSSLWREADLTDEELRSPFSNQRRSFCHIRQRSSSGDDNNSPSATSPIFPSYMAVTESAKAKMRSMSTPRQRIRYLDQGNYFERGDSYGNMKSSWSAFNCEMTSSFAKCGGSDLKSLSMRSLQQP